MKRVEIQSCVICKKKQYLIFKYQSFEFYKCSNCQLVSTYPFPSDLQIKKHYQDGFSKRNYKIKREYAIQYIEVYKQIANILDKELDGKLKSKKVLDVGCFTGEFLEILNKRGADVRGIELQEEAVKIANRKLPGKIIQADLNNYKIKKEKFDVITLLGIIEHIKDPLSLLKQCHDLLNKDGIILIQTPNSSSLIAKTFRQFWPPYSPVEHIHLFGRKSMLKAFELSGFNETSFKNHWKKLPVGYVYQMLEVFGPEFKKALNPVAKVINKSKISLSFYVGEMIIIGRKK